MCIIVLKSEGVELAPKDTYEECFSCNNDGAGFAYWNIETQQWDVEKGFMTFKSYWDAFSAHNFQKQDIVVSHFRIGTSGNKDGGNTHPFNIVRDYDLMRETKFSTRNLLFHNGVIHTKGDGIASDTMYHVKYFVAPLLQLAMEDQDVMNILETLLKVGTNKWVLLLGNEIKTFGYWHDDFGGNKFSNTTYRIYPKYNNKKTTTYFPANNNNGMSGWDARDKEKAKRSKGAYLNEDGRIVSHRNNDFNIPLSAALYDVDTGEIYFEDEDKVCVSNISCPNCHDDSFIADARYYGYSEADSICGSCGAVFDDHTGKVHLVNSTLIGE